MEQALDFLKNHKEVVFATSEGNRPKIRLFQIMGQESTALYFATSPQKAVYKQLRENPYARDSGYGWAGKCALYWQSKF